MRARLSLAEIDVTPGTARSVELSIANTGDIVEEYTFDLLGELAPFVSLSPATVQIYPGDEARVAVTIDVPRSSAIAHGDIPLAIRVVPQQQPGDAAIPEAVVRVARFGDTVAELSPRTVHGRGRARTQLAIDNPGNAMVAVLVEPVATDGQLRIDVSRPDVTIEPGRAAFTDVVVKASRVPWTGSPRTLPFALTVRAAAPAVPVRVDGVFVVDARIPRWLPKLLIALLLGLLALALLWWLVLRPAVQSAAATAARPAIEQAGVAQEKAVAAEEAAAAMADGVEQAKAAAVDAGEQAAAAEAAVNSVLITVQDGQVIVGSTATSPFSARISLTDAVGGAAGSPGEFPAPDGGRIDISDIVFQNPFGASGTLRVTAGERQLYILSLDNFRDLDYHFVTPVRVGSSESLSGIVECTNAGTSTTGCQVGLTLGGTLAEPVDPAVAAPVGAGVAVP